MSLSGALRQSLPHKKSRLERVTQASKDRTVNIEIVDQNDLEAIRNQLIWEESRQINDELQIQDAIKDLLELDEKWIAAIGRIADQQDKEDEEGLYNDKRYNSDGFEPILTDGKSQLLFIKAQKFAIRSKFEQYFPTTTPNPLISSLGLTPNNMTTPCFITDTTAESKTDTFAETKADIKADIKPVPTSVPTSLPINPVAAAITPTIFDYDPNVRLPELKLKPFDGTLIEFPNFIQSFRETIDSKPISPLTKLQHLRSLLRENAYEAISGYNIVAENYPVILQVLEKQFGDPLKLKTSLFNELRTMPQSSEHVPILRQTWNNINRILQQLLLLHENTNTTQTCQLIYEKFPQSIIRHILQNLTPNERFLTTSLMINLDNYIDKEETANHLLRSSTPIRNVFAAVTKVNSAPRAYSNQHNPHNHASQSQTKHNHQQPNKHRFDSKNPNFPRKRRSCLFCAEDHSMAKCMKYKTVQQRTARLREIKKCFKCLYEWVPNHECPRKFDCPLCDGHHPIALCFNNETSKSTIPPPPKKKVNQVKLNNSMPPADGSESDEYDSIFHCNVATILPDEAKQNLPNEPSKVNYSNASKLDIKGILMIAEAIVAHPQDHRIQQSVHILFDGGSEGTFMNEKLINGLKLQKQKSTPITIQPFLSSEQSVATSLQSLDIKLHDGSWKTIRANTLPKLTGKLDWTPVTEENGNYSVSNSPTKVTPSITIGSDQMYPFLNFPQLDNGMTIFKSQLGPIATGTRHNSIPINDKNYGILVNSALTEKESLNADIQKLWTLQNIGISDAPDNTEDDDTAIQLFQKHLRFDEKANRYVVALPWKDDNPDLAVTKNLALGRLLSLIKRLNSMPEVFKQYHEILQKQLESGIIELVDEHSNHLVYYIPHHVVVNENKLNPKPRIVLDASVSTRFGKSLNKNLHRGPVFLPQLIHILIRLRLFLFLMVADIEKAFHQILIREEDRDCTRFLWLKDINLPPTPDNIVIYRFARVVFGVICSPFMLSATVDYHLRRYDTTLAHEILKNIYVDNIFVEFLNPDEALHKYQEMVKIFNEANMPLREFATNCPEILKYLRQFEEIPDNIKLLGLYWNLPADTLGIKIMNLMDIEQNKITMRIVLKNLAKIYDIMGFICPILLKLKILLQSLHLNGYKWDDILKHEDQQQWKNAIIGWDGCIITLPRLCPQGEAQQIHIFVDASALSFAAVGYLRSENTNMKIIETGIILAKMQIKPKAATTIPRMELLAMLLGTKLLAILREAAFPELPAFIWSDSTCVLGWIFSKRRQCRFVENRLQKIRSTTNVTYKYVPTAVNVADKATRGLTPNEIQNDSEWWNGPKFLKRNETKWPQPPSATTFENSVDESEQLPNDKIVCNFLKIDDKPIIKVENFSSYTKLLKTMLFVLRAIAILIKANKTWSQITKTGTFNNKDSSIAERILIREQQLQCPPTKNQIRQLNLQQDKHNIWRCNGRLEKSVLKCSNPVWLPEKSWLTKLVIIHAHQKLLHAGTTQTLATIRNRFWICRGRQIVQSAVRKHCFGCKRFTSAPYALQQMPQLPECRVTRSIPFQHTGVDYAGPMIITVNREKSKCWVALFTCLVTRACHIELITNLTTNSFLCCFRRFISRRNVPKTLYSDNATTFTLAAKGLDLAWNQLLVETSECKYFTSSKIEWKFITPLSPWEGGVYERMIGIMKKSLKFVFKKSMPFETMSTILCEVEAVINSRPLTFVSNELGSMDVLRPADFLQPNSVMAFPIHGDLDSDDDEFVCTDTSSSQKLIILWKKSLISLEKFWNFWSEHYLTSLRETQRLRHNGPRSQITEEPQIGDIVIVQQEDMPRSDLPLARIIEITKRQDDAIKAVKLEFADKTTKLRPLNAIIPLEAAPKRTPEKLLAFLNVNHASKTVKRITVFFAVEALTEK